MQKRQKPFDKSPDEITRGRQGIPCCGVNVGQQVKLPLLQPCQLALEQRFREENYPDPTSRAASVECDAAECEALELRCVRYELAEVTFAWKKGVYCFGTLLRLHQHARRGEL